MELLDTGNLMSFSQETSIVSTLFITFIDTKGGTDIPPILKPSCSVDDCVTQYYFTYEEFFMAPGVSVLESLQTDFLEEYERLRSIFSLNETRAILCEADSFALVRNAVVAELKYTKELSDMLDAPENEIESTSLPILHDTAGGRLLLNVLYSLCGAQIRTDDYSILEAGAVEFG